MSRATTGRRKRCAAAGVLLALAVVGLALVGWDAWLKHAPGLGYCPEGSAWIVAAEDLPEFWTRLEQTDVAHRIEGDWPRLPRQLSRLFRDLVEASPTANRWQRWLGPQLLAAQSAHGFGVCVRPGLLMRFKHWRRCLSEDASEQRTERGQLFTFGALSYTWCDGFLVASASRDYVIACLARVTPRLEEPLGADEIHILVTTPCEGFARIRARDGLPVSGSLHAHLDPGSAPLTLPNAWPAPPLLAVATSDYTNLHALVSWTSNALLDIPLLASLREPARVLWRQLHWDRLADGWHEDLSEYALAVMDVDTAQVLPVPEVALVLRQSVPAYGVHPLESIVAETDTVPYEWEEHPGVLAPLWGEKAAVCLGQYGSDWLATSQEPLMAALVGKLRAGAPVNADMSIRVDWHKLGTCAETLVRRAAALELIPRMNAADAEVRLVPSVRNLARFGTLRLDVRAAGDERVVFEGLLAEQRRP